MKNSEFLQRNWKLMFLYVQQKHDCFKPFLGNGINRSYLPCLKCINCNNHIINFLNLLKNDNSKNSNN